MPLKKVNKGTINCKIKIIDLYKFLNFHGSFGGNVKEKQNNCRKKKVFCCLYGFL